MEQLEHDTMICCWSLCLHLSPLLHKGSVRVPFCARLVFIAGRYSLSVMRLLVPTSRPDAPPIGEDQPGDTVSVDIDIAGVPTPPFAASLLSGEI